MDSAVRKKPSITTKSTSYYGGLDDDTVLVELNKAKVRISDEVGSFCSLVDISRKTYGTWQTQFAQPDFVTYLHTLNCSFHDSDRDIIHSMLISAFLHQ